MDNKEWYTIKEIADELKVTKQAVRKRVDNLDSKLVSKGVDGKTILINIKGVELLRNKATHKVSNDNTNTDTNFDSNIGINSDNNVTVDKITQQILQDYVNTLKEQLEEKDKQIQELLNKIDQEQKLHAMTQQKVLESEDKQSAAEVQKDKESLISKWRRFFQ